MSFSHFVFLLVDDPCHLPTTKHHWYGNVSTLRRCFQSIKLDRANARTTLAVVRRVADMYAFTERAAAPASSGMEYALDVRLLDALTELEALLGQTGDNNSTAAPIHSEFEFQCALASLLHQLHDGNTHFRLSNGFAATVYRPYVLSAHATPATTGLTLQFRLRQSPYHAFLGPLLEEKFGFDIEQYVGREVLAIGTFGMLLLLLLFYL
jgi:hypothetical protein